MSYMWNELETVQSRLQSIRESALSLKKMMDDLLCRCTVSEYVGKAGKLLVKFIHPSIIRALEPHRAKFSIDKRPKRSAYKEDIRTTRKVALRETYRILCCLLRKYKNHWTIR